MGRGTLGTSRGIAAATSAAAPSAMPSKQLKSMKSPDLHEGYTVKYDGYDVNVSFDYDHSNHLPSYMVTVSDEITHAPIASYAAATWSFDKDSTSGYSAKGRKGAWNALKRKLLKDSTHWRTHEWPLDPPHFQIRGK